MRYQWNFKFSKFDVLELWIFLFKYYMLNKHLSTNWSILFDFTLFFWPSNHWITEKFNQLVYFCLSDFIWSNYLGSKWWFIFFGSNKILWIRLEQITKIYFLILFFMLPITMIIRSNDCFSMYRWHLSHLTRMIWYIESVYWYFLICDFDKASIVIYF